MSKIKITKSEMKAYQLLGGNKGLTSTGNDGEIKEAADKIVQLAEKIKSERRKASM